MTRRKIKMVTGQTLTQILIGIREMNNRMTGAETGPRRNMTDSVGRVIKRRDEKGMNT